MNTRAGTHRFTLEEVFAQSATNAWAAVTDQNKFLHWDGTAWSQVSSPVRGKASIAVVSNRMTLGQHAGRGYRALGWHTWTLMLSPVMEKLNSIAMISAHEGWIVGENGTILHGIDLRTFLPSTSK